MSMTRTTAERVAMVLRRTVDEGRWSPELGDLSRLFDLERLLPIRIQAGQPALEAMNDAMIREAATDVLAAAMRAMAAGGIACPRRCEVVLCGSPPPLRAVDDEPFGLFARAA